MSGSANFPYSNHHLVGSKTRTHCYFVLGSTLQVDSVNMCGNADGMFKTRPTRCESPL